MDKPEPIIELRDIVKVYSAGKTNEYSALHGITLTVNRGEFVAIRGVSGSGKSTLMNIIGCLDRPTSGEYRLEGESVTAKQEADLVQIRRHKIGFVFQSFNLLHRYTALANVELPLLYQGVSVRTRHARAKAVLEQVGLGDRIKSKPSMLSGGEQQRVAIARALITKPAMILADEPTGNLDTASGAKVMELLKQLHQGGSTIILVTHDPAIAEQAQRAIHIVDGSLAP